MELFKLFVDALFCLKTSLPLPERFSKLRKESVGWIYSILVVIKLSIPKGPV